MTPQAKPKAHPRTAACKRCGRAILYLQACSLTGDRDHARKFSLCEDCIKEVLATSPGTQNTAGPEALAMSETEKRQETRRQKAFERLGTDHPVCPFCGETDWRCMELHHLEGEQFGKTLICVCRNCHRKLSDSQKDHPPKFGEPPNTLEQIAHALEGLADLFVLLAQKLRAFAAQVLAEAKRRAPTPASSAP